MSNINKIKVSGQTYNIQDENAALASDVFITASNRNSIQSRINEGIYSLSTDDVYTIVGTKANATDVIKGLIIVDNVKYNFTGSTSSDVQGVSGLDGIVTFDLASPFSISLVNRDTNHINELFIETFTADGEESPMSNVVITHNPTVGVNKIDYVSTLYTEFVHEKYALADVVEQTKQDTLVSGTNIKTINNQSILGSGNITIQGGGASVIEVTQAQYDALVEAGTLDLTALYIITDATAGDLSNYYTKTEVDTALASKQTTLTAGTGISIVDNVISAEGGGSITIDPSLDSGSTNAVANSVITKAFNGATYGSPSTFNNAFVGNRKAYAIICNVPNNATIWSMRCYDSSVPAYTNIGIKDNNNFYDGSSQIMTDIPDWIDQELSYYDSTTRKRYVFLKNGVYADYFANTNSYTFTIFETNNTGLIGSLLSKHSIDTVAHTTSAEKSVWNAKLDSSAITTSISSSSTDSQVPSAKAVYDQFGGLKLVKLSQSEYDSLSTKDSNTLYVIVN